MTYSTHSLLFHFTHSLSFCGTEKYYYCHGIWSIADSQLFYDNYTDSEDREGVHLLPTDAVDIWTCSFAVGHTALEVVVVVVSVVSLARFICSFTFTFEV